MPLTIEDVISLQKFILNQMVFLSVQNNELENLRLCLAYGSNILPTTLFSAWMAAISQNKEEAAIILADYLPNLQSERRCVQIFMLAIEYQRKRLVQVLINKGVPLDVLDGRHFTPLMQAVQYSDSEMIDILLSGGADINQVTHSVDYPLLLSLQLNKNKITKYLIEKGARIDIISHWNENCLFSAIYNNFEIVKLLIDKHANVNQKDSLGQTALHRICLNFDYIDLNIPKLLIESGNIVNERDNKGCTPLHLAAFMGRLELIDLLLKYPVNINAKSDNGNTPLICAADLDRDYVLRSLIERGSDINHVNNKGQTALICAYRSFNHDNAKILLENGADIFIWPRNSLRFLDASAIEEHCHDLIALHLLKLQKIKPFIDTIFMENLKAANPKLTQVLFEKRLMSNTLFLGYKTYLDIYEESHLTLYKLIPNDQFDDQVEFFEKLPMHKEELLRKLDKAKKLREKYLIEENLIKETIGKNLNYANIPIRKIATYNVPFNLIGSL